MSALGELEPRIDERIREMDDAFLVWTLLALVGPDDDDPAALMGARNRRMMEITRRTVFETVARFVPAHTLSAALETQQ